MSATKAALAFTALRKVALALPDAEEGIACEGTPLERSTFKSRKKAFLFMGGKGDSYDAMVKLRESVAEACALAAKHPGRYKVGAGGWVKAVFASSEAPPRGLLERWIAESYRVVVEAPPKAKKKTAAKKKSKPG